MSVAIGIECDGGVWLAADSAVSLDGMHDIGGGKLIPRGSWAMASVGWGVVDQLLAYHFSLPGPVGDELPMQWACTSLVPALRKLAADHAPWAPIMDGDSEDARMQKTGFQLLVAANGWLLAVDESFCVHRSQRGYFAIGAGAEVALGAMHATHGGDPRQRCISAVKAASAWIDGVAEPVELHWVPA